ncbi:hypothetical protein KY289_020053 [Solanum tuberosum]|nr:hypothetical protein KY289_020053 [Solanum tuberosum]
MRLGSKILARKEPESESLGGKNLPSNFSIRGGDDFVTIDGVRVSDPNLFVGSRFVVHGLDGILLTGFNMYEDTLSQMGKVFFAPEKVEPFAHKSGRHSASAMKNGGFSRVMRKHRKLQYCRIWKSNYSVRRNGGEDDF